MMKRSYIMKSSLWDLKLDIYETKISFYIIMKSSLWDLKLDEDYVRRLEGLIMKSSLWDLKPRNIPAVIATPAS